LGSLFIEPYLRNEVKFLVNDDDDWIETNFVSTS